MASPAVLFLLLIELYVVAGIAVLLHHIRTRQGLSPLVFYIAGLTIFLNYASLLGVLLPIGDALTISVFSAVIVPNILMIVLMVYVLNGTFPARLLVVVVAAFNLLFALMAPAVALHAELPDTDLLFPDLIDVLFSINHFADVLASTITFTIDMVFIVIIYQGTRNYLPMLPRWVVPGIALVSAVWIDAVLFRLLADLGTDRFVELLPGDVLAKTVVALLLAPVYSVYMERALRKQSDDMPTGRRPLFDVIFGGGGRLEVELLRSEAELRETKANLQQLTEHIGEVFWLVSPDWQTVYYVSPAFESIWGYKRAKIYDDPALLQRSIHPEDQDSVLFSTPIEMLLETTFRIYRADETMRWVRTRVFPIVDEDQVITRLAMITADITAQKEVEERQFALETEQKRVQVMRDFIHEAAHDLRSPITSLILKVDLLNHVKNMEQIPKFQADMRRQIDQLAVMIDDLFTLSRIENSETYALESLELKPLLQKIHRQLQPIAQEKSQQLLLSLQTKVAVMIMGDALEFERAISNLVNNAMRYTPDGGLIDIHGAVQAQQIVIKVSDTGIGIDEDELSYIFERFKRARTAVDAGIEGTGLGLAIVKQIVEKHNGTITVDSTVGQGTVFTITLPLLSEGQPSDDDEVI